MARGMETADAVFGRELERLRGPLFEFLRRLTRDYHAAQDLTQETFLRALRAHRARGAPERLSGWVFRIAYRAALDRVRRRPRIVTLPIEEAGDAVDVTRDEPRPAGAVWIGGGAVDRDRALEEVRGAIFALPARDRMLFLARYDQGRSCGEAAEAVGITEGNAKIRMLRGRKWIATRVLARLREEASGRDPAAAARRADGGEWTPGVPAACAGA